MKIFRFIAFVIYCLIFTLTHHVFAQENNGNFLFRDSKLRLSTFYAEIAPGTSWAWINDQFTSIFETSGGFILNNKLFLAVFGASSPKLILVAVPEEGSDVFKKWEDGGVRLDKIGEDTEFLFARFKHFGLKFGYLHQTQNTVFWRAGFQYGFSGGFRLSEDITFLGIFDNVVFESSVNTYEPSFGIGVNLLNWWRVFLDVGYRFVDFTDEVDESILEEQRADSISVKLIFGFGNYKFKK